MTRWPLTWYCYLLSSFFTIILNVQGNIIPFLRDELALSYRGAALHPAAIAAGMIVAGVTTDRAVARFGRRGAFRIAVAGSLAGVTLLGVAASPALSVGGCLLVGLTGAMIPGVIAGLLAQLHGARRDQAYAECGAVTYAFAMAGGLSVGGVVALGFDWRMALALVAAFAVVMIVVFDRYAMPDPPPRAARRGGALPAACIAYLVMLFLGVALEYAVLLWCPAFLELVAGLGRAQAAAAAASFSAAMLVGRWGGSFLVRGLPPTVLAPLSLALAAPGFALYWGVATPFAAIAGVFLLGLSIALLYPLSLGFAIGAAGRLADTAGARSALAAGSALLLSPLILGALADSVGLRAASLAIPALALAILAAFGVARRLERGNVVAMTAGGGDANP